MLTEAVVSFAVAHQQYFMGVASGYVAAHAVQLAPQAAGWAFHQAMKVPWFRAGIVKDPERAKAIVKAIEAEIERDIDAEAATGKPANKAQDQPK